MRESLQTMYYQTFNTQGTGNTRGPSIKFVAKKKIKGDFEAVKNMGAAMRRNILERNLKNHT